MEHIKSWSMLTMLINWVKYKCHKEKDREDLLEARKEVGLQVHNEKIKYVAVSRHQNVGQNQKLLTANLNMWQSSNTWERK
jgi:hypothetical protein